MNGHATALYIEDLINVGHTYVEYRKNGSASVNLLKSIGFLQFSIVNLFLTQNKPLRF